MSGSPGVVNQTPRSIRSIHCRQFYTAKSNVFFYSFTLFTLTHANANTTHPLSGLWSLIRHSRIYTIRKMFDCKKCPVHWGSFIKHHGLFVPYIVDIFDCEKYNIHLVSFIKNHGLFVPYIDDIFIFLIRISWLSPTFIHSPIPRVPFSYSVQGKHGC